MSITVKEIRTVCQNCKMIDWNNKTRTGYLCRLRKNRMYPTTLTFFSCEYYNVKHDTRLRLLWKSKQLLYQIVFPFSFVSRKINHYYLRFFQKMEKKISIKKIVNFSPGFPKFCVSCKLVDRSGTGYRGTFLCKLTNNRYHKSTLEKQHVCRHYNAKHLWLLKLVIKIDSLEDKIHEFFDLNLLKLRDKISGSPGEKHYRCPTRVD